MFSCMHLTGSMTFKSSQHVVFGVGILLFSGDWELFTKIYWIFRLPESALWES